MTEQDERYGEDVSSDDESEDVEAHKKKVLVESDSEDGDDDFEAHKKKLLEEPAGEDLNLADFEAHKKR